MENKPIYIPITPQTKECLRHLGIKGETYDTIIKRMIEKAK